MLDLEHLTRIVARRLGAIELVDSPGNLVAVGDREAHLPASGERQRALAVDVERVGRGDEDLVLRRRQWHHVKSSRPAFGNDRQGVRAGATQIGDRESESTCQRVDVHRLRRHQ